MDTYTLVGCGAYAAIGICCNTVCPGSIHIDMGGAKAQMLVNIHVISYQQTMVQLSQEAAMHSLGKLKKVADVTTYLAGLDSSFFTGAIIPITDGIRPGL